MVELFPTVESFDLFVLAGSGQSGWSLRIEVRQWSRMEQKLISKSD